MRRIGWLVWVMAMACSCTPQRPPAILGISEVQGVQEQWVQSGQSEQAAQKQKMQAAPSQPSELPQRVVVTLDIYNPTSAAKLCEGRVRISYKGRNVVILSLEEKVKIAPRRSQKINLPLRVSVARNSSALAFKEAFKRGDVSDVSDMKVDWSLDVRAAGLRHHQIEQSPVPLSEVFSAEQIEAICGALQ